MHSCRWISTFIITFFVRTCVTLGSPYSIFLFYFIFIPYVNCVRVIFNCTYVMWTRPCIIMIVLLQSHCGSNLLSPFLCCMLSIMCTITYPVALMKINVMISPMHILVLNLLFKKYPTLYRRCFVGLMSLLLLSWFFSRCVIIFVWFSILRSLLFVIVACLLVVVRRFVLLSPLEIVRSLEILLIDFSFWSLVSHVPVLLFPCGTFLLNWKEFSFQWFLICSWKLFAIAMVLSCFADELVCRFICTVFVFVVPISVLFASSIFLDTGCNTMN